ncbi:hypothetical protein [Paraburkholderia dinghuensis]|nr:hypothetical protein [Paraburkholderia dinghuensis]
MIGDVMEKLFPVDCWCCSALRGMLYGGAVGIPVGIALTALVCGVIRH